MYRPNLARSRLLIHADAFRQSEPEALRGDGCEVIMRFLDYLSDERVDLREFNSQREWDGVFEFFHIKDGGDGDLMEMIASATATIAS